MLVAGFGLLRMLRASGLVQGKTSHLLSISGTFLIAPEYMAPEMVQGQAIDVRADVYALGAILFELLCGKAPFSGADPMSIARQHITQPAPSLRSFCPEVPVALESVINQALERDPARRFPYISELVEAFAQVSVGATGHLKIVPGLNEQGMPANGYSSSHWQLTPPIVTGKLPAVKLDGLAPYEEGDRSGNWQLRPPIVTGKLPAIRFPVEPEEQLTRDTPREHQAATSAFVPRPVAPASPNGYGGQSIRPFDWWSMPGPVQEPSAQPREAAKPRATPQRPPGLGGRDMAMKPLAQSRLRQSRRVGRRDVVSILVVGGIVAAGVGVVLNLDVLTGNRGNVPRPPVGTSVSLPANSIGGSNMALNSALDFINPADKKPSLLIRMPDGHYVAYEKACTHENVYVHYDAGTHTLICPAHGAVFDPADGGKVLQGPAVTPLPQVKVRVLADGTVVAG
jgi:nitrite reductase/ring-hydroxylating ferredoxin subunit